VLCVNVVAHLQTREGIQNLNSLVESLNVDLVKVNVRPSTLKKIRNAAFFKIGNPNWAEHRVIFAAVARTALLYHVPLVVWGEDIATEFGGNVASSSAEAGSAEELINNDLFREASLEDLIGDEDIRPGELLFYLHPDKAEFASRGIRSIYLGYYRWWDGTKHYEISKSLGFRARKEGPLSGNILDYDNIDEKLCEIHIWFKFLKLGFWRPHDQCCYKIWNGYMTREEAVKLVHEKQYEFPKEYFQEYLEYHEITEAEYRANEDRWRNPLLWQKTGGEWRLKFPLV
jgi:N-acetyl sugar amidotransferase